MIKQGNNGRVEWHLGDLERRRRKFRDGANMYKMYGYLLGAEEEEDEKEKRFRFIPLISLKVKFSSSLKFSCVFRADLFMDTLVLCLLLLPLE